MRYEQLLDEAVDLGLTVKEKPLQSADGRTYRNRIAVRQDMTTARKTCVLAEEIVRATEAGYTQVYEMAEFLDVDEEFLRDCLIYYGILDISL